MCRDTPHDSNTARLSSTVNNVRDTTKCAVSLACKDQSEQGIQDGRASVELSRTARDVLALGIPYEQPLPGYCLHDDARLQPSPSAAQPHALWEETTEYSTHSTPEPLASHCISLS